MGRATDVSSASASRGKLGEPACDIDVPHHHREWFLFPVLAFAQRLNSQRVVRIAGQMIAANAFDGDDLAVAQELSHRLNCAGIRGRFQ